MLKLSRIYLLNRAIKFPEDIEDTCDLLLLADEYMLVDLKQKCEEDISSKLNVTNLL